MARFTATFAGDTVGAAPAGWTSRWVAGTHTVVSDATAFGGKALRCSTAADRQFLSFDAAGSPTDFEILSRVRIGSTGVGRFWMAGRGDPTIDCIQGGIYTGTSITLARYVNGGGGLVTGGSVVNKTLPVGTWFRQRMRVVGNQAWYRQWNEGSTEPTTWDLGPLTDTVMAQVSGWVGLMFDGAATADRDVDWFSVGTNGDTALEPTAPSTATRNVRVGGAVADRLYLGATPVDRVYVGNTLAWGAAATASTPTATPDRVWHYENLALGAGPAPAPWSEYHGLRDDQRAAVSSPAYPGTTRAMQYNVKPGDTGWGGTSGTLRSEGRASIADTGNIGEGTEQWWAWPTYFPADFNWDENNQFLIFTQWRHANSNGANPCVHFWSDVNENLMLEIRGGTGGLVAGDAQYTKSYNLGQIGKGRWNDFLVHFIWSSSNTVGLMEVWHDGVKVHGASDATKYVDQSIYVKQGIYSAAGTQRQHFVTHGPLRRGSSRAAVESLPALT